METAREPTRLTNRIRRSDHGIRCALRVGSGTLSGTEVSIPPIGLIVGAAPGSGLLLTDDAVSGRHVSIIPSATGIEVTDLGSRNGTWINGVKISKVTIPIGTRMRVGATELLLIDRDSYAEIPPSAKTAFGELVGRSVSIRTVYALLERAAQSNAPVLLLGESGTGKELAARAVHTEGTRKDGPFVVFDCGAASSSLLESGLFGHKKGAFTGAHADQLGAFARAHGGTLFLDEIGELPLALQPKLLRMLERGEVLPLGGTREEKYDVRIVSATHRDLSVEVSKGTFREDLYYRLAVIDVEIPALRHRLDDISDLTQHFLARAGRVFGKIEGANLDRLCGYAWPGNVRELRNVLTKAVALGAPAAPFSELPILVRSSGHGENPPPVLANEPFLEAKERILSDFERAYMQDLMKRANGNISEAARIAGVERKHLYKILERVGLRREADEDA